MMMKRYLCLIPLLVLSGAAVAQAQIQVGDVLDLEERVLIKKMNDELNKPNPNAPPAPPVVVLPKPPKIVHPTVAMAVYGTSATFYEGQLAMGGKVYTVRTGTPVQDYVVTSVAPHGIELEKQASTRARSKAKQTLFLPVQTR